MTVESATYISQLNTAQPTASDNISEGDDHLRLIKSVLQAQFPNLGTTAARPTAAQLNKLGFETGMIIMWSSAAAPTTQTISGVNDWLLCDGSAYFDAKSDIWALGVLLCEAVLMAPIETWYESRDRLAGQLERLQVRGPPL